MVRAVDAGDMEVAVIVAAVVLLPTAIGAAVGAAVRPGDGYRQTPAVAGFAALGIVFVIFMVADAITPTQQCVRESCDHGNAVGAMFMFPPIFGLAFIGAWLGRLAKHRGR
jgi:hypothetical protein